MEILSTNDGSEDELEFATEELPKALPSRSSTIVRGTGALVAAGTIWLGVQTLGTKVVMLLGQIALAELLLPADFGQIAMAYTVTSFVTLLINPGIDLILVQRGRRFDLWSTPAFYLSLAMGLLGAVVVIASAPLVTRFYDSPQLTSLLTVLAISTPLGSLLLVPTAKLRAQMRFKALAAINLFQATVQTILTVSFAAIGLGVYAFVLPMPLVYLSTAAVLFFIARPVVHLRNPFRHWRYLIGDSSYIFGQRVLHMATGQGDYIMVGRMYGAVVLGPYFFAYSIAKQAIRLTAGSVQLVLMAGLARMPAYSVQQTQAALRATRALAAIGMPFCMLQAALADPVLRALYGEKWVAAIPLVQLLSVGLAFDVVSWPAGSLMQARGQFRAAFFWSGIFTPIFLVGIFIGAIYGQGIGVALAVCLYSTLFSPWFAVWVFRTSNVAWREIFDLYLRPSLIGILTASVALGAEQLLKSNGGSAAFQFVVGTCAGLLTMAISTALLMPSTTHELVSRIKHSIAPFVAVRSNTVATRKEQ